MRKSSLILVLSLTSALATHAQEESPSRFRFGFQLGSDLYQNAYRMTEDNLGFTYYGLNPGYSAGIDGAYQLTGKLSVRLETNYSLLRYGMNWNYGEDSNFYKTITTVHYAGLRLNLDYTLWEKGKLQWGISSGLAGNLALDHQWKNLERDGDTNRDRYNVLSGQYPRSTLGVTLDLPFRYRWNDFYTLRIEPGATVYLNQYLGVNDGLFTRQSLRIGIEYRF